MTVYVAGRQAGKTVRSRGGLFWWTSAPERFGGNGRGALV